MKKLLLMLATLLTLPMLSFGATATFTADTTTQLLNPERGWYLSPTDSEMTQSTLQGFVSTYNTRLFFYRIALNSYQGTDTISGSDITRWNGYFTQARLAGVKLIVMVSYDNSGSIPTTPVARMVLHAQQLQTVFYTNRDVIAFVEAGFIGAYGEWADPSATLATKTAVRDAVMSMVPPETMVAFTNSYTQMNWFPTPLTAAQAFSGSKQSRMGWHNDCYFGGPTDAHQFPGPTTVAGQTATTSQLQQRQYMAAISEYTPSGGELTDTCGTPERNSCFDSNNDGAGLSGGVMNEFPRYHVAWFNYPLFGGPTFLNNWTSQGCINSVINLMGYRVQLDSLSHADTVSRGSTLTLTVNLHNYGWSRFFSERRVKVTLSKSGATDITCMSANDLRELPSQSSRTVPFRVQCAIPSGATVGAYAMYLSMPDKTPALSAVRAYSVRPANANSGGQVWDDALGRFATGTAVTIN